MKCIALIAFCIACSIQSASAVAATGPAESHAQTPVALFGATQFDLASKISGRTYRIFVYKPLLPPPASGYPVIFVTDGNGMFPLAAAQMALMGLAAKAAVVVGVGYPTDNFMRPMMLRYRDLTPVTEDKSLFPTDPPLAEADQIGGSELFYRFITEELRPALSGYPLDPKRQTLFGHSLGGLFVLGVMFKHPEAFNDYVASSPSIWWDNKSVLKDEAAFLVKAKAGPHPLRVLICVGAKEQDPMTHYPGKEPLSEVNKKIAQARMVDNARDLAHRLAQSDPKSALVVRFQDFSAEDHLSVVPAAISRALNFALEPTTK